MIPDAFSVPTARGEFTVRPVSITDDLDLVHRWMNLPHVAEHWHQAWPADRLRDYLADQVRGSASRPCLGLLDGEPVSYWEIYRPVDDPLGEAYPARDTDLGVHLLIGEAARTGHGLGGTLLAALRDGLFAADPRCGRIVAEPDVRNVASVRVFARAGFRRGPDIELAGKTAALMIADRPDDSTPDGPTPDGPTPGGSTPDGSAPDGPAPGGSAPDGPAPDGPAPDGSIHDGSEEQR